MRWIHKDADQTLDISQSDQVNLCRDVLLTETNLWAQFAKRGELNVCHEPRDPCRHLATRTLTSGKINKKNPRVGMTPVSCREDAISCDLLRGIETLKCACMLVTHQVRHDSSCPLSVVIRRNLIYDIFLPDSERFLATTKAVCAVMANTL